MADAIIDMRKLMKEVRVEVKLKHAQQMTLRIRIACVLIRFACWIAGFAGVDFEREDPPAFG